MNNWGGGGAWFKKSNTSAKKYLLDWIRTTKGKLKNDWKEEKWKRMKRTKQPCPVNLHICLSDSILYGCFKPGFHNAVSLSHLWHISQISEWIMLQKTQVQITHIVQVICRIKSPRKDTSITPYNSLGQVNSVTFSAVYEINLIVLESIRIDHFLSVIFVVLTTYSTSWHYWSCHFAKK